MPSSLVSGITPGRFDPYRDDAAAEKQVYRARMRRRRESKTCEWCGMLGDKNEPVPGVAEHCGHPCGLVLCPLHMKGHRESVAKHDAEWALLKTRDLMEGASP